MLDHLRATGLLSRRKARLLAIAVWQPTPPSADDEFRQAFDVAIRYADGSIELADAIEWLGPDDGWIHHYEEGGSAFVEELSPPDSLTQSSLLYDLFGNPFRSTVVERTWVNSSVLDTARCICGERAFDQMPLLAAALEDAGCHCSSILDHCRSLDSHVCGCWVVDLLLGNE